MLVDNLTFFLLPSVQQPVVPFIMIVSCDRVRLRWLLWPCGVWDVQRLTSSFIDFREIAVMLDIQSTVSKTLSHRMFSGHTIAGETEGDLGVVELKFPHLSI